MAWLALKMDAARQKETNVELKGMSLVRLTPLLNTKKTLIILVLPLWLFIPNE